jgi:hypothetical protein
MESQTIESPHFYYIKALSNQAINCVKTLQKEMNIDFKTFVMDDTAVLEPGSVQNYIKNKKKLSKEMLDVLKTNKGL